MIYDENKYCKRCGNCCRRMIWKKKYSFNKAFQLVNGQTNRKNIEDCLIFDYSKKLQKAGLPIKKLLQPEWNKKKEIITVPVKVGKCKYLFFTKENKAICLNYENRPNECRIYLCKKARQSFMLEKIKRIEKTRNVLLDHVKQQPQKIIERRL